MLRKFARYFKGNTDGLTREFERRRAVVEARRTDYFRWSNRSNYDPLWAERLAIAVSFLGSALWVVDLGCGAQDLRGLLPPEVFYLPMDIVGWTADTLTCDINAGLLPPDYLELADVCCMMGVLEYVYDPDRLMAALSGTVETLIVSYNATDFSAIERHRNGWVNSLSVADFLALLDRHGYRVIAADRYLDQIVVKAVNSGFGAEQAVKRKDGREAFLGRFTSNAPAMERAKQKTGAP
jgi:hypothetical protein